MPPNHGDDGLLAAHETRQVGDPAGIADALLVLAGIEKAESLPSSDGGRWRRKR